MRSSGASDSAGGVGVGLTRVGLTAVGLAFLGGAPRSGVFLASLLIVLVFLTASVLAPSGREKHKHIYP